MRASLLGYIAASIFASLWLGSLERSDSVTQWPADPRPDAECIALEGGPLRCTLGLPMCDTDSDCAEKFGGDGGPEPRRTRM